jgi:short-subunit dehydrogenase
MHSETVLITGASSGIGAELARLFAADGSALILTARREDRLTELAQELKQRSRVEVQTVAADLSRPDAPSVLFDKLAGDGVSVDVLVNCAGFGARGAVADLSLERQREMLQVNVLALTELTRLFVAGMRDRGRGGILNVASTAAFQPGPYLSTYYASKAYVLHFTEGLAEELRGTPLKVTCLAPGPTHTEFAAESGLQTSLLFKHGVMSARDVARAGYSGFRKGRVIVVPGFKNKALAFLVRLTPRILVRKITKRLQA